MPNPSHSPDTLTSTQRPAWQAFAGKYREVILSILLFIFLDLGVLILNYVISFQIQGDAVAVNLSGRQRMLSQRITKTLYQIQAAQNANANPETAVKELQAAYQLFDVTLTAFDKGGTVTGGDGKPAPLAAVKDPKARQPVGEALALWSELRANVDVVLAGAPNPAPAAVAAAIASADKQNLALLKLMNTLTTELERIAQNKGAMLRTIQTVAIVLVLLNFAMIMVHVIGKLRRSDEAVEVHAQELENANAQLGHSNAQLEYTNNALATSNAELEAVQAALQAAKSEADTIFATVRQGLFLLGPDGVIGAQHSEELKTIFQTDAFAGRNLVHLLRPLLPEKRHQTVADYCDLLFNPRKNDKQLAKFNPLKRVELNFPAPEGGFQPKHVEFAFQRIVADGEVVRTLVTAMDVTERVKLEEQLKSGEKRRQKQFELLFELLQVESAQLRKFIEEASAAIERINGIFMEPAAPARENRVHDKVQRVFRIAHTLKAQAASLGLLLFERSIHEIEDKLNELRKNPSVMNEDLLTVLVSIANFQTDLEEAGELIEKVANLRRSFPTAQAPALNGSDRGPSATLSPSAELRSAVDELCTTVLSRLGKQCRIDWQVPVYDSLPGEHRRIVRDAVVQLVRNSLVHGIEFPAQRSAAGKDPHGSITIRLEREATGQTHLRCRDDGAGLDTAGIRAHAVREGLIAGESAAALAEHEVCALIFEPGFSTASTVTEDAGRGVGLDALRAEIVDELDGEIRVQFAAGRYCEFHVFLPAA